VAVPATATDAPCSEVLKVPQIPEAGRIQTGGSSGDQFLRGEDMKRKAAGIKIKLGNAIESKNKSNHPKHRRKAHWNPKAMIHQGVPAE
jgi:hypothetical protein